MYHVWNAYIILHFACIYIYICCMYILYTNVVSGGKYVFPIKPRMIQTFFFAIGGRLRWIAWAVSGQRAANKAAGGAVRKVFGQVLDRWGSWLILSWYSVKLSVLIELEFVEDISIFRWVYRAANRAGGPHWCYSHWRLMDWRLLWWNLDFGYPVTPRLVMTN